MKGEKRMKRFVMFAVAAIVMVGMAGVALAEDIVLTAKVEKVIVKNDKNGAAYARVLFTEKATLNGVEYNKTVSAVAFGDQTTRAKAMKKGDTMKVIASKKEYKGAPSYQILQFMN
jgi:hypothetical protein